MKKIAIPFDAVRKGEKFTIQHIPAGKELVPENAIGPVLVHGIKLENDEFDALLCRAVDWKPIGRCNIFRPDIPVVFVERA